MYGYGMGDSNLMDTRLLSDTLARLSSGADFIVKTEVSDSSDYDTNVVFLDPSKKPSWSEVQGAETNTKWVTVRGERDEKLLSCDWTQLDDVPLTAEKKSVWQSYRQELRDITNQPDPFNITWPTPPA